MKKVFVLFWCDIHHSHDSKRIAGVFDHFDKAFDGAIELSKKDGSLGLGNHDQFMLKNYKQTQDRDENYIIEEWKINQLLDEI